MSKNTLGGEAFEGREPVDPLAPVRRGLEFIEGHRRPWLAGDNEFVVPEALATLRGLADQVPIVDLSEHAAVDPDPRASIHRYPPMRSEMPLPILGDVVEQLRSAYGQPHNPA